MRRGKRGGYLPDCGRMALAASLLAATIGAQVPQSSHDPNRVAIPYPRVRLLQGSVRDEGTTAWLRQKDPFLLYQLGRDLVNRQFTRQDGAYGRNGELSVPLYVGSHTGDGRAARFARDHAPSCGSCHSVPYREPGAGQTIASTSGAGRNTTHFYGAGLLEMLAAQVRADLLATHDQNGNGYIDRTEIRTAAPARVAPRPGADPVDFGDLSPGPDGVPRLNPVFRIWYVDAAGEVVPEASSLDDPRVAGFDFALQPFGWGRGHLVAGGRSIPQGAEGTTVRAAYTIAADVHMGLQAFDPVQRRVKSDGTPRCDGGGLGGVSLNGARQFVLGGSTDCGHVLDGRGFSLDDPDRDGRVNELSAGDLDAVEFFMLHAAAPATRSTPATAGGADILRTLGCVRCHIESWQIRARDDRLGLPGDRRFFELQTHAWPHADGTVDLSVQLRRLWQPGRQPQPSGRSADVSGFYSDLRHWDIGASFHERRYDGSLQRQHRTAPLWGVGSTAPYGHAGQFDTLEQAISAHAGAAAVEAAAYRRLLPPERRVLLDHLESMVLPSVHDLPADIDGDGRVDDAFRVAGQDVGYERFDPPFLFARPPRLRFLYDVRGADGRRLRLGLLENVRQAYGLDLLHRRDRNHDGLPDVLMGGRGTQRYGSQR